MKSVIKRYIQRGSSLIEIVISVAIVGLVLTGIVAGLTMSIKSTAESKYRSLATEKAQELIEYMRRERHRLGWNDFYSSIQDSNYCFDVIPAMEESFDSKIGACGDNYDLVVPGAGIAFKREASIEKNAESVKIEVRVFWPRFDQDSDGEDRFVFLNQEIKRW